MEVEMAKAGKSAPPADLPGEQPADEEAEDAQEEMSHEERMAVKRRCLRFLDILLLLVGAALCGGALYCSTLMFTQTAMALMYSVAAVGGLVFFVTVVGMLAICTSRVYTRILLGYFTFLIFLAFAMLVVGGFCLLLTSSVVASITANWTTISSSLPPSQRATMTLELALKYANIALYSLGCVSLIVFALCVAAMSQAVALVTPSRAYTVFLQATNIAMLPIGAALVASAVYVADTAIATQAAVAAFAIFILGVFVVVLLLVGCAGTSLQSRGIVRLFMFLTFALSLAFFSFGTVAFVQTSTLAAFITSQWNVLRHVLPPDFSGTYDKEQFQRFINTNLTALGFLSLCAGIVLGSQTWAAFRLRHELKEESQAEMEAWEAVRNGTLSASVAESISALTAKSKAQVMWKQQWTKGTKYSRRLIWCGCGCACAFVLMAIAVSAAAVYYSTNCAKMSKYTETMDYAGQNFGPFVVVQSNFSLGVTRATVDTATTNSNITVAVTKSAFKQSMASDVWPAPFDATYVYDSTTDAPPLPASAPQMISYADPTTGRVYTNATGLALRPVSKGPSNIFGYDVSCQSANTQITVPRTDVLTNGAASNDRAAGDAYPIALRLEAYSNNAAVTVDMSNANYVDRPRLRSVSMATTAGALTVSGALIGSVGLTGTSTLGAIDVTNTEARCDPALLGTGKGGIRLTTTKGTLTMDGLDSLDCDVSMTVGASLSAVVNSRITNTLGGGTLRMVGAVGVMQVKGTYADVIDVKGDQGSVQMGNVTVGEALRVATTLGTVSLQTIRASSRASIQVETDSGDIDIWATQFRGLVTVVTGGNINCISGTASGFNDASPCSVTAGGTVDADGTRSLRFVDNVAVNCRSSTRDDCPYLGHITVTSNSGNVVLRMDRVTA